MPPHKRYSNSLLLNFLGVEGAMPPYKSIYEAIVKTLKSLPTVAIHTILALLNILIGLFKISLIILQAACLITFGFPNAFVGPLFVSLGFSGYGMIPHILCAVGAKFQSEYSFWEAFSVMQSFGNRSQSLLHDIRVGAVVCFAVAELVKRQLGRG